MEPNKRFTNSVTEGNLWLYILSLGKDGPVQERDVVRLIFEKFGFLPGKLLTKTIILRLGVDGYISKEELAGEGAYRATEKGLKELEAMKSFTSTMLQKL
jgi:DNA-binding PadR family transcriptional regulator